MMAGTTFSKFFWQDWTGDDELSLCSMSARGVWMGLLVIAARSSTPGHVLLGGKKPSLADLRQAMRCPPTFTDSGLQTLVDELSAKGVCDLTREGIIVSRRMVRDARRRKISSDGGKSRQKQRIETEGENSTGTRRVVQPPSTTSQNPSTTSHQPPPSKGAGESPPQGQGEGTKKVVSILFKALGWNPSDWDRYHRVVRQMGQLKAKGIHIERELVPCIEQMRAAGRIPEDISSLAYFEKPVLAWREAQQIVTAVKADIDQEVEATVAAMSVKDWESKLWQWLFDDKWFRTLYGPSPTEPGCRVPENMRAYVVEYRAKMLNGKPYARYDRCSVGSVPFDWPENEFCPRRLDVSDLHRFYESGGKDDARVPDAPDNVVPLRKAL